MTATTLTRPVPVPERPPIVCLCGSTRFIDAWNTWRKTFTEAGFIVLAIEVVTTQARSVDPQHVDPDLKHRLDELHKRKIDLADEVFVLNVGGYIGESTRSEINYAHTHAKPVRYLEPTEAEPIFAQLTGPQADGIACVICGRDFMTDHRPAESVGRSAATGSQVFACEPLCAEIARDGGGR